MLPVLVLKYVSHWLLNCQIKNKTRQTKNIVKWHTKPFVIYYLYLALSSSSPLSFSLSTPSLSQISLPPHILHSSHIKSRPFPNIPYNSTFLSYPGILFVPFSAWKTPLKLIMIFTTALWSHPCPLKSCYQFLPRHSHKSYL